MASANCSTPAVAGYDETHTCIEVPSKPPAEASLPETGGEVGLVGGAGLLLLVVGVLARRGARVA